MRINTTTTSTRGKALRRCINPLPTKFSSNSTWTNFHFRISKTKHAPQTKQGANMKLNMNCDVHWAFIFWHFSEKFKCIICLALFVLSELHDLEQVFWHWCSMEILKIPDNVGSCASWRKERLTELANWNCDVHWTLSSWHRSKSLSPLSNRDECKEGKLLRQSRPFCTNLEAFD